MPQNKIFLDTNKIIDLVEKRNDSFSWESIIGHQVYVSPLSIHILYYVGKYKIPMKALTEIVESYFGIVDFDKDILKVSLEGPTNDLEDNIQLHSAVKADCDVFLTDDAKLLKMKFFGRIRVRPDVGSNPTH